jgi:uncharacterized membrane protein YcaP (DUF421 family)
LVQTIVATSFIGRTYYLLIHHVTRSSARWSQLGNDDVLENLRLHGVTTINELRAARLERDAGISVIL